jgi:arabinogalactan endo-1,4-beta-galactosidase
MELVREHPIRRKRHVALISTLVAETAAIWGAVASAQVVTIQENTLGFCSVQPVMSCEYTNVRRDLVNSTFRNLPNNTGWGTFIWEPTAWGDTRPFTFSNNVYATNAAMDEYARFAREAGLPVPSKPASQLAGTTCQ